MAGIVYALLLQRLDLRTQQESHEETQRLTKEQTASLRLAAELSAVSALLSYYLQERELARSRQQHDLVDDVQVRINQVVIFMEERLEVHASDRGESVYRKP